MCIDGEVDTAVRTQDGSTYIFMSSWFWKLNTKLDAVVGNSDEIRLKWHPLNHSVDTSFHISANNNKLNGKTFFIAVGSLLKTR